MDLYIFRICTTFAPLGVRPFNVVFVGFRREAEPTERILRYIAKR